MHGDPVVAQPRGGFVPSPRGLLATDSLAKDMPIDEVALVARAKQGDRDAQDALCRKHLAGLHAWVRLKSPGAIAARESSMDLVQTVFREALGDLHRFEWRGDNSFRNWLLTYANNKLRNRVQFHHAERRDPAREVDAALSEVYASMATPSQVLDARERVERFERAFAQLSAGDQQLIVLARVEGLPHAEIAVRLQTTEAASKKALSRAMVRLAAHMQT